MEVTRCIGEGPWLLLDIIHSNTVVDSGTVGVVRQYGKCVTYESSEKGWKSLGVEVAEGLQSLLDIIHSNTVIGSGVVGVVR